MPGWELWEPLGFGKRGIGAGLGVKYLSSGSSVWIPDEIELAELLLLLDSNGTSSTFKRCPGSKGQNVVDG